MISWGKRLIVIIAFFLLFPNSVFAQSDYVLPYPSVMPGGVFYKIQSVIDYVQKYWYFGNFSQFTYNLGLSDKYLVEAKTLFEYKQYLLALDALKKSNNYFILASNHLKKAHGEGKNILEKQILFNKAIKKHKETLIDVKKNTPHSYVWTLKNNNQENLEIWDNIDIAINIKNAFYE